MKNKSIPMKQIKKKQKNNVYLILNNKNQSTKDKTTKRMQHS